MSGGVLAPGPVDTTEVREAVRSAIASRTPLRLRGSGTWLDAGAPVEASETLSLAGVTGIVDYVPGDLTLTARAGTTLSEIARVTRAERQWLALDPFGSPEGTLGATIATGSAGPLAAGYGPPRDAVLGVEVVTGKGAVVRGGGRVVKNVAGFDLCRVFTGSWGTLGAITEVTVRLRALPEDDRALALALPAEHEMAGWLDAFRGAPLAPLAAQLCSATACQRLGLDGRARALIRLAGNEGAIIAQRASLAAFGDVEELDQAIWHALARIDPEGSTVVRLSRAPARLAEVWASAQRVSAPHWDSMVHACTARGIARCIIPDGGDVTLLDGLESSPHVVVPERLPAEWWARLAPAEWKSPLSARVRAAFDPHGLMNRGILGGAS